MMRLLCLCAAATLGSGCFSTELDSAAVNAFACGKDAGDAPCPDDQTCSLGRCRDTDAIPRLTIDAPTDGESIAFAADVGDTFDTVLQFAVGGEFELVDPDSKSEHVFGEGHIVVSVDGTPLPPLTSGIVGGGREVGISIPNTVGVHRISVELRRNDGERYDHGDAVVRNLFWMSDGTPRVAVTRPWPGETFSLDEQIVDVEVGVVDFEIVNAGVAAMMRQGHVHVHYDDPFPECPERNDGCDGGYIVIADSPTDETGRFAVPNESIIARLPDEASPRQVEVTAILRHIDHKAYRLPDEGDDVVFPPDEGDTIFDTITIERR